MKILNLNLIMNNQMKVEKNYNKKFNINERIDIKVYLLIQMY
jgi:hypothetical protein